MRRGAGILLICSSVLAGGCGQPATNQQATTTGQAAASSPASSPAPASEVAGATPAASPAPAAQGPAAAKAGVDPCSLLTSDEIKAVQGEAVREAKPSRQSSGGLVNSQCFYALPTYSESVSLTLTESDPAQTGGQSAKEFWRRTFGEREAAARENAEGRGEEKGRGREDERDKQRVQGSGGGREAEEERSAPPERVRGLGDEAFWTASRFGGALYVLKGERFVRISLGGRGDAEAKLSKAEALAREVLRRL